MSTRWLHKAASADPPRKHANLEETQMGITCGCPQIRAAWPIDAMDCEALLHLAHARWGRVGVRVQIENTVHAQMLRRAKHVCSHTRRTHGN